DRGRCLGIGHVVVIAISTLVFSQYAHEQLIRDSQGKETRLYLYVMSTLAWYLHVYVQVSSLLQNT
ncbi:MAG: hypothetical protein ACLQUY_14075, partial [Ktedonobacterales bacterium]